MQEWEVLQIMRLTHMNGFPHDGGHTQRKVLNTIVMEYGMKSVKLWVRKQKTGRERMCVPCRFSVFSSCGLFCFCHVHHLFRSVCRNG